jgi:hypothetical protein
LGCGVGGLGFGVWAQRPNPQSPIPNPQSPWVKIENYYKKINIIYTNNLIFILLYTKPNQLFIYIHIYKSKKNLSAKK